MTKRDIIFTIAKECTDLTDEAFALLKRLDGDDFTGPAASANKQRFKKLCRNALMLGKFPDAIKKVLEEEKASLYTPGRPALPESEKRKPRSVKLSDAEWEKVKYLADKAGVSVSEHIRQKSLGEDVSNLWK